MQEEPLTIITRMNRAYNAIYGTHHPETRRRAEQKFYRCQECLRQRGIAFHQTPAGTWILDPAQTLAQSPQQQEDA